MFPTHNVNCSLGTLSSLQKARPLSHVHCGMSDYFFFVSFPFLSDFSASLPLALAPQNPIGNPWVHATNGTALQPGLHLDSPALQEPPIVSEFPGQNGPNAQNMNVRGVFSHVLLCRNTETDSKLLYTPQRLKT